MKMKKILLIIKELSKSQGQTTLGSFKNNPFKILISTILSQRTRDENTEKVTKILFSKYKTPKQIAKADLKSIQRLIKSSGFYRTKAKRIKEVAFIIHKQYKGKVPKDIDKLLELPGVGRKTANCVLVYAFQKQAIPVDTHVHRISNRIGLVNTKTPEKTELELIKTIPKKYWLLVNELFIIHGKTVCKPIKPLCGICRIKKYCDYYAKNRKSFE